MDISLLTDAPKHNYALMRIAAYHKAKGDHVFLNEPLGRLYDMSYGSWLFNQEYFCDINGGPAIKPIGNRLGLEFPIRPDYSLYSNIDYSLGFTWEYCPRKCGFCVVPKQKPPKVHRSIWEFHDKRFKAICLLNNNTFSDPKWYETFEEIWAAKLAVRDENGYDLRLLDVDKVEALKRTKFEGYIHFSWDCMDDEDAVVKGLLLAREHKLRAMIYILVGYDTTRDEDIYRCQIINNLGFDPYPMPYNGGTRADRAFKRFVCLRGYRGYRNMKVAWENYRPNRH